MQVYSQKLSWVKTLASTRCCIYHPRKFVRKGANFAECFLRNVQFTHMRRFPAKTSYGRALISYIRPVTHDELVYRCTLHTLFILPVAETDGYVEVFDMSSD